ncbi:MAG TPA: GNAT family N-acetyltransferase, partial [Candidatus Polarisedimenticolia bacterium]|nr:GNAT family N-acetyltransferase [Candidatus Polarisedimenticolia bacterium]
MTIEPLGETDLPALERLFEDLALGIPRLNLDQFCRPRGPADGIRIAGLAVREENRIGGAIGWLDLPFRSPASGAIESARWPINIYLRPELRGRGLGSKLMEATREGARFRIVIGGNAASIPVLERTGWKLLGELRCYRWRRPCLDPRRLSDRLSRGTRRAPPATLAVRAPSGVAGAIRARRVESLRGRLPWLEPGLPRHGEAGTPRTEAYLTFAFGGPLAPYHLVHSVSVDGALAGYFVLGARAGRRGLLECEIVDLDAVEGFEAHVVAAGRAAALTCADVARLRCSAERFDRAALLNGAAAPTPDLPLRVSCDPSDEAALPAAGAWHLTY